MAVFIDPITPEGIVKPATPDAANFLTLAEIAERLNVSKSLIQKQVENGYLHSTLMGGNKHRVHIEDFRSWLSVQRLRGEERTQALERLKEWNALRMQQVAEEVSRSMRIDQLAKLGKVNRRT